jgi:hypothetical protein
MKITNKICIREINCLINGFTPSERVMLIEKEFLLLFSNVLGKKS